MIPEKPKIYHITHIENIPSILKRDALLSDARCCQESTDHLLIGISDIKRRRLEEINVSCYPGRKVGDFIPFYFCPRSVMLFIIHKGNHQDLKYSDGQSEIVHLESDLYNTIKWADEHEVQWAFTNSNAGAFYTQFYNHTDKLKLIDWDAVSAADFRNGLVREGKQAEFLLYDSFPLHLIDKFGMINSTMAEKLNEKLSGTAFASRIAIEPTWYY